MLRSLILSALLATSAFADVEDRRLLSTPDTLLQPLNYARIVASDSRSFLAHQQRITRDGVLVDAAPLAGTSGIVAPWSDGWIIASQLDDTVTLRHLGESGPVSDLTSFQTIGRLEGIATNGNRIAVVESRYLQQSGDEIWVSILEGTRFMQRRPIVSSSRSAIARYGDGFLLLTSVQESESSWLLYAWKLDGEGTPLQLELIERSLGRHDELQIEVSGRRALVTFRAGSVTRASVLDEQMKPSTPVAFGPPTAYIWNPVPIAVEDRFLVAYSTNDLDHGRIAELSADGRLLRDDDADPISASAHIGETYLVARPWGIVAVAERDPRTIASPAITITNRVATHYSRIRKATLDGVTMVIPSGSLGDREFLLLDESGRQIAPRRAFGFDTTNASLTTLGASFIVVWRDGSSVVARRLDRNGEWLDTAPRTLFPVDSGTFAAAAAGDADDLFVAWTSMGTLHWRRFDSGLNALGAESQRPFPAEAEPLGYPNILSVDPAADGSRLILIAQTPPCRSLCVGPPALFVAAAVTPGGEVSPLRGIIGRDLGRAYAPKALQLTDGTWIVPAWSGASFGVVRLTSQAEFLEFGSNPLMRAPMHDLQTTPSGWRATFDNEIVEMRGFVEPVAVTGLDDERDATFLTDDALLFLDFATPDRMLSLWAGRLRTVDGDLALSLRDVSSGSAHRIELTVTNRSSISATNVTVRASAAYLMPLLPHIPSMRAGESATFIINAPFDWFFPARLEVLSSDVRDIDPSNNTVLIPERVPPSPPRLRGTRR